MRYPILTATILMAATFALHVFGGGPQIHVPIQSSNLPPGLRAISAILWHMVSAELAIFTLALSWLVRRANRPLELTLAAVQAAFAGLFLFYGQTVLGSIWILPQWMIFLALTVLILWGGRQDRTIS